MFKISPFTPLFFNPSDDIFGIQSKYVQKFAPSDQIFIEVIAFSLKNRHKAQRKAKFYINKCRSASCMQSGLKQASA